MEFDDQPLDLRTNRPEICPNDQEMPLVSVVQQDYIQRMDHSFLQKIRPVFQLHNFNTERNYMHGYHYIYNNCNEQLALKLKDQWSSLMSGTLDNDGIEVVLNNKELWDAFSEKGTEMIINRTGRRMFPHVDINISGLDLERSYSVGLVIQQADSNRYKFIDDNWRAVGITSPKTAFSPPYIHEDSPAPGHFWNLNNISFRKLKLSNQFAPQNIYLESMHKYDVNILVIRHKLSADDTNRIYTFVLKETSFIAVTAYQNKSITRLKIENNPFARAFKNAPKNIPPYKSKRFHKSASGTKQLISKDQVRWASYEETVWAFDSLKAEGPKEKTWAF